MTDPISTLLFSGLAFLTTIPVLIDCLSILMEGVPNGIDLSELEEKFV